MNMLRHRRLRRRLGPYLDGELDAGPAREVGAHLRDCWGCSGDAELHRLIRAALRHVTADGTVSLPVARLQRFARRLAHQDGGSGLHAFRFPSPTEPRRLTGPRRTPWRRRQRPGEPHEARPAGQP